MTDEPRKKRGKTAWWVWYISLALALISLSGCASHIQPVSTTGYQAGMDPENDRQPPMGWWYARFKIKWSGNEDPAWHNDLLIAHRVIAPVLARHRGQIPLWRFHRRAADDQEGHRFSFVFYSTARDARGIFESIRSSIVLDELKTAGLVVLETYDDTVRIIRPGIDGVSDKSWSPPLCRSWPYFIMGVSETWLGLIREFAGDGRRKPLTIEEMSAFYLKIEEELTRVWAKEGKHAYLHHLNAVFGYAPMKVGGKDVRF